MNNNNNILSLNNKKLQYIITKNKNTIKFLENTGSLIVYEPGVAKEVDPDNEVYRELWVGSYFLAAGFGAQSRSEQQKLSYIAENYDNDYLTLDTGVKMSFSYSYNLYTELDNKKVTQGTETREGSDISYNPFDFGGEKINLNELYDKFKKIQFLYKFEIENVEYTYKFYGDNNPYDNMANVPIGKQIQSIDINIKGNTRDSGGIDKLYVILNNQYSNNSTYTLDLSNINNQESVPYNSSNTKFNINISKTFDRNDNYLFIIHNNINEIIKSIHIYTKQGNSNDLLINPLDSELIDNITEKFPSYLIGNTTCYVCSQNSYIRSINNYEPRLIIDNVLEIKINSLTESKYISVLMNNDNLRLAKAEFFDNITCGIYDITDFILVKYNSTIDNQQYTVEYLIYVENNSEYDPNINPPFLHKNGSDIFFNTGHIRFTFISSNINQEIVHQKTSNQYWINYNVNDNNLPI